MTTVQINDEFRVIIDSYNHTLEQQREVINPKTKEVSDKWCFIGYYPNMKQCLNKVVGLEIAGDGGNIPIQWYLEKLEDLQDKYNLRTQ